MHEKASHDLAIFVTLTYSDEHLPADGSLHKEHFQLFMKRLRKHHEPHKIRFFHCGEYGEEKFRPHYHAILFGVDFSDRLFYKHNAQGDEIFTSATLDNLWGYGNCNLGAVSFESCAYVARYITKKITGELADDHYRRINPETGEIYYLEPEYCTMSRRPGIGADWFARYASDVFPSDSIVVRGKEARPPRYYSTLHERADPKAQKAISYKRIKKAKLHAADNTPERLAVKLAVRKSRISQLKRTL